MGTLRRLIAAPLPRAVAPGGLRAHPYARDQHSGAGNCWCGRHEEHQLHRGGTV